MFILQVACYDQDLEAYAILKSAYFFLKEERILIYVIFLLKFLFIDTIRFGSVILPSS